MCTEYHYHTHGIGNRRSTEERHKCIIVTDEEEEEGEATMQCLPQKGLVMKNRKHPKKQPKKVAKKNTPISFSDSNNY